MIKEVTNAMANDALATSRPVQKYVATPADIAASFGSSTYDKVSASNNILKAPKSFVTCNTTFNYP